jgi:regulator of protease activity HflC (stomatin/prohibitin superfamily)
MQEGFTVFTILFLVLILILWKMFVIVPTREACIKERLGKFKEVLPPGFHFMMPFVDRIAYRQEMREQVLDVPPQSCITKDNIQVEVDGLVYIKVVDGQRACYGIEDYRRASVNLAQTTMRSEIGKLSLDETFSERDIINENIVREIDKASEPWGIKVLRYEIKNITPGPKVLETLEKQMEAERQKRAEIILANADKEAMINHSEGERTENINISEGQKQKTINEAEGRALEITLMAEASANGLRKVAQAISRPGGSMAVKMRIIEQFIQEFGNILRTANVSVVPSQLASMRGFFQGMNEVGQAMEPDGAAGGDAA